MASSPVDLGGGLDVALPVDMEANANWFESLTEALRIAEYNESRSHSSVAKNTPNEIAKEIGASCDFGELQIAENSL